VKCVKNAITFEKWKKNCSVPNVERRLLPVAGILCPLTFNYMQSRSNGVTGDLIQRAGLAKVSTNLTQA